MWAARDTIPDERFITEEWQGWAERGAKLIWRPNLLHTGHGVPYLFSRALYDDFRFFWSTACWAPFLTV